MSEKKSTLDKEYFKKKKKRESEWTKDEKEIRMVGRTCQVKIPVLSNTNTGCIKCGLPSRFVTQEGF